VESAIVHADIREYVNDFNIQAPGGQDFQWIIGLFYLWDQTDTNLLDGSPTPALDPFVFKLNSTIGTRSYAAYAQATKTVLPDTRLTLGFRYTSDHKSLSGENNFGGTVPPDLPPQVTFEKPTWRISLDHRFNPDLMAYVSYNRGFVAGNYSQLSLTNPAVKPEVLDAYELGFKSDLLDKRLRLNSSIFYYDFKDLQLRDFLGTPAKAVLFNAANADIYGWDLDFTTIVTKAFNLNGGFELLRANYTSFPNGVANYPRPILATPPGCVDTSPDLSGVPAGGTKPYSCDLTGNRPIQTPDWQAYLAAEYTVPSQALGEWVIRVADKYVGSFFATPDNFQRVPSHHWLTASVNWSYGHLYAKLWGTNLTDSFNVALLTPGNNTQEYSPGQPRMYGFTLGVRF
jgi:iron complex outermembrane receptor protein